MVQNDKVKKIIKHRLALSIGILIATSTPVLSSSAFALEALDDQSLKDVTGEGIAFTLSDFSMQYKGADDSAGTGYTRIIPVGPLSQTIDDYNVAHPTTNIGKADVWLYGLSISGNDGDSTKQFSGNTVNIGTADNPWLISVNTVTTPNFAGVNSPLSILTVEAPLQTNLVNASGALLPTDPNSYDLKLGTWADAFVRDPSKVENLTATGDQFDLNGANRANRLRLQAIINGVSLNGTNLKMFQTLGGAETATGLGPNYSSYNNTLGLALTARINSGNAAAVRGPVNSESETDNTVSNTGTVAAWTLLHGGWNSTLSNSQTSGNCNNSSSVTVSTNFGQAGCQYMVQTGNRTISKTRTVTKSSTWSSASGLDNNVIRLSTQEKGTTQGLLSTPAINGGAMPTFADNEGLFLYKPNINLVLGSQWQPLVFGVADDGKNLAIELTRIPNSPNVYQQIYTDYTGTNSSYKGGTCSVYWCGGAGNGNSVNATHSSISIGSVDYTAPTATKPLSLEAYKGADSVGVSFGSLMAVQGRTLTNTGSNTTTANVTQAHWIQRTNNDATTWTYRVNAVGATRTGTANQWAYNETVVNPLAGVTNATFEAFSTRYRYPIASGNDNTWSSNTTTSGLCGDSNCTYYGTINNRNWTVADMKGLSWSTADNAGLDSWLQSQGSTTRANVMANQAATPALPTVAQPTFSTVNLGSAVIDGMLIQHMKITTKGL
ncbi:hypothetical protein [Acinetobacter junii]|uniref:hypothetical protein n=1 Tax=Acinetobacter junii TaxID=40215 RepID=UPI000579EE08|nr:hypothetical protein [Acinetobacter junii]